MTLTVWISLLAACVVISLTPGAGAINTMSNSLAEGWRRSIWGIIGQQLALVVYIVVVAAGVGLLVSRFPVIFDIVRYAGAAYLAYLGVRMIFAKTDAADDPDVFAARQENRWAMVRRGFWVNILNPKAVVFFLAFMPQFVRPDQPQLPQYLIVSVTMIVVDIAVMWFVFAGAAGSFRRLTRTPKGRRGINITFGVLFIAVALMLLFMRH